MGYLLGFLDGLVVGWSVGAGDGESIDYHAGASVWQPRSGRG